MTTGSIVKPHDYQPLQLRNSGREICGRCLGDLGHRAHGPARSWAPFSIDAKTFAVGERIEVMRAADDVVEVGTFAGTVEVGLGTGILIDVDGVELVYLASEIKAARHLAIA